MRFPGSHNCGFRKLCTNLVYYPRLHFCGVGMANLNPRARCVSAKELLAEAYSPKSFLTEVDWRQGQFFTTANLFSGSAPNWEAESAVVQFKQQSPDRFVKWIADNSHTSVNSAPGSSVLAVMNTTSISSLFQRVVTRYSKMFKRNAFMHCYLEEGMERMEFMEAEDNLRDHVNEYQTDEATIGFEEE